MSAGIQRKEGKQLPITQFACPFCNRNVPTDHYVVSACGEKLHPDYAAAVLADSLSHEKRALPSVTMGLGCVRKQAIMDSENVAINPLSVLTPLRGTAWHKLMEDVARESLLGANGQRAIGGEIDVVGEVGGVKLTGSIDRVRGLFDGRLVGEDHKTGKDARAVFILGGKSYGKQIEGAGSPMEYKVQLSLYAELYRQVFGVRWDGAIIWWWFNHIASADPIEIIPVEQCLAHKPYSCDFTVGELLKQAADSIGGAVKWQDLPLAGLSIKFGKSTGCDYCVVRDTCLIEHQSAPF